MTFVDGEQRTSVAPAEFVLLEVECTQKRRATRVDITLRWPNRPLIAIAEPKGDHHGR